LLGSLSVRRRRVWLRLTSTLAESAGAERRNGSSGNEPEPVSGAGSRSPTLVEVGGLARNDSGNFTAEFEALLQALREVLTQSPVVSQTPADRVGVGAGKD
jgi:cytochrome c biogenesis protein